MASSPPQRTLGPLAEISFLGLAGLFDLIKFLLLFLNAIPIFGTVIDGLGSLIISVLEILVVFGGLWIAGAYRNSKSSTTNALFTLGASMVDMIPFVDDLPVTTVAVLTIIIRSRMQDKLDRKKHSRQVARAANDNEEQAAKVQAAQNAEQRANRDRQKAMQESLDRAA